MIYAAILGEYQRVMIWKLILKKCGPNIQHIALVNNKVAGTLSTLTSKNTNIIPVL